MVMYRKEKREPFYFSPPQNRSSTVKTSSKRQ